MRIVSVNQLIKQALNWIEMERVATPPVSVSSSEVVFAIKLVLWLLQFPILQRSNLVDFFDILALFSTSRINL